ncbi:MAG: polyhydroxyalkanoate depolymerase, partial [Akkermansiaceae bacterium]|nr:polyhydroxyalkanoate depolymerase [Akkermansiaceae bacterium]
EAGYYELEINALGTLYEAFFVWQSDYVSGGFAADPSFRRDAKGVINFNGVGFKSHPRGRRIGFMRWDFPGLRSAVHVDGTLNDDSDRDNGWSVEFAFPWHSAGMHALARADKRAVPPHDG